MDNLKRELLVINTFRDWILLLEAEGTPRDRAGASIEAYLAHMRSRVLGPRPKLWRPVKLWRWHRELLRLEREDVKLLPKLVAFMERKPGAAVRA